MARSAAAPPSGPASPCAPAAGGARGAGRVAPGGALVLRVLLAPFALALAAAAGLLFAALLPVCGIATIAEATAKGAWRFVRDMLSHAPPDAAARRGARN